MINDRILSFRTSSSYNNERIDVDKNYMVEKDKGNNINESNESP